MICSSVNLLRFMSVSSAGEQTNLKMRTFQGSRSYLHNLFRRRQRAKLRFRRIRTLRKFASLDALVSNHFNHERSLSSKTILRTTRTAALIKWRQLCAA
jgi:hypothetical protein